VGARSCLTRTTGWPKRGERQTQKKFPQFVTRFFFARKKLEKGSKRAGTCHRHTQLHTKKTSSCPRVGRENRGPHLKGSRLKMGGGTTPQRKRNILGSSQQQNKKGGKKGRKGREYNSGRRQGQENRGKNSKIIQSSANAQR